jgi:hypothetical protein
MVAVVVLVHPFADAVMVNVVLWVVFVVLVSVPAIEAPVPDVRPVKDPVLSLVQLYDVPATPLGFDMVIVLMAVPEQTVCVAGVAVTAGIGFTVTVNVLAEPVHPFAVAVTDMVATRGAPVELLAVNAAISPVPLVPNPTSALLVQANVAPGILLVKLMPAPAAEWQ